ncbi:hypothetical protein LVJ94_07705 [Pendulispora rubella]|uniref:Lipoprotein n=1 Tax=Pendulispora rubella TaxID=2741070 RepID=A0ABZ2L855_9BACT
MQFVRSSVAVLVCLLVGCAADPETSEPTDVQVQESVSQQAPICPLKWTCDSGRYYGTKAQCETACGVGACYRDYACTGGCVCP